MKPAAARKNIEEDRRLIQALTLDPESFDEGRLQALDTAIRDGSRSIHPRTRPPEEIRETKQARTQFVELLQLSNPGHPLYATYKDKLRRKAYKDESMELQPDSIYESFKALTQISGNTDTALAMLRGNHHFLLSQPRLLFKKVKSTQRMADTSKWQGDVRELLIACPELLLTSTRKRLAIGQIILADLKKGRPQLDSKRIKQLFIKPAGERMLDDTREIIALVQERILAPLSPADQNAFMELLLRLVQLNNGLSRAPLRIPD